MNTTNIRFASNRLRDVRARFQQELAALYPAEEVNTFFAMLCEEYLGFDTAGMLLHLSDPINQSDLLRFHWALEDLLKERPIQHIIGHVEFYGCRIEVNENVLIPRPETEEIVQHLCRDAIHRVSPSTLPSGGEDAMNRVSTGVRVLDLCTGSGCIAIALKKALPEAEVSAVDISEEALAVARGNAQANGVEVNFLQGDVLDTTFNPQLPTLNLIVSNPPYVLDSERATMRRNVLEHDPELALFVPDGDALRFYRAIARFAQEHLERDGLLAFEINPLQAHPLMELMEGLGFETTLRCDSRGRQRLLLATLR